MGANWCNTLQIFSTVPEVRTHAWGGGKAWEVYAFEAAPLIAPFVERCCQELGAGRELPHAPVPPAGSSMQLLTYAPQLGCNTGGRGTRLACVAKALEKPLQAMRVDPSLTGNWTLIDNRLSTASPKAPSCERRTQPQSTYTLIPAAVGAERSSFQITTSPIQMLRGGSSSPGGPAQQRRSSDQTFDVLQVALHSRSVYSCNPLLNPSQWVPPSLLLNCLNCAVTRHQVDVVSWLQRSFHEDDFVLIKMDVEGAERSIIPKLLATNASRLVDVLLWECHMKWRGQQVPGSNPVSCRLASSECVACDVDPK